MTWLGVAAGRCVEIPEPDDAVVAACGEPLITADGETADGAAAFGEGELGWVGGADDLDLGKAGGCGMGGGGE